MNSSAQTQLSDLKWIDLKSNADDRGVLTSIENQKDIPFEIKRIFYMHHIVSDRGGHSHFDTDQLLIAISGQFKVDIHDSLEKKTFTLNDCTKGFYVPRQLFTNLHDFSPDGICLVLASTHYDRSKSQRSFEDFMTMRQGCENV